MVCSKDCHELLKDCIDLNDAVVDATCGNGHDTLFLSKQIGDEGKVFAVDVQIQAIEKTRALLKDDQRITYVHDSHANIEKYLQLENIQKIGGAIFNLGYLPGSDKSIITKGESTWTAVEKLLLYLKKGGRIVLVVYHGHDGGKQEKDHLLAHVRQLNQDHFTVLQYQFINQKNNPPFIVAIEKK